MARNEEEAVIPDMIHDKGSKTVYKRGAFFGKGGFAKCYEIFNAANETYACKAVSKKLLLKEQQKDKMAQEIEIHKSLNHPNVVGFLNYFEDDMNIYIILELCRKRSMMELHKRRKALTEPETRYYMKQMLNGVSYLHQNRIIHRDLKLGNLLLNDDLVVKIADFGLATRIECDGERKKTLCGTPNYIAPEILHKRGHSFEVDIWSIGCIMYTLLAGRPPFETNSLKETYSKIKKCDYKISVNISAYAKDMIMRMLQSEPKNRPKVNQLLEHKFISTGYCPSSLPLTCLTMPPRFDRLQHEISMVAQQQPQNVQSAVDKKFGVIGGVAPIGTTNAGAVPAQARRPLAGLNVVAQPSENDDIAAIISKRQQGTPAETIGGIATRFDARDNFNVLRGLLKQLLRLKNIKSNTLITDEMTDPDAQPMVWVSKWVDYSDKYGFGYQLSDECVGVMFNDTTKFILLPNAINVHYIDQNGEESYMTMEDYPRRHEKKIKLLSYFNRYMREHLIMTGSSVIREGDSLSRTPHLHQWCRSTSGVLMQLTNGTVQINFTDHTKIIMCPLMAAITYIDEAKAFRTFRFTTLQEQGCVQSLYEKLNYAYDKISMLYQKL